MLCINYLMNTDQSNTSLQQTAINGLAVVGFVALVAGGIWLAIYSTRFVPEVIGRVGAAAVYLGSVIIPAEPSLSAVSTTTTPTASTTISFGETNLATDATGTPPIPPPPKQTSPTAGDRTGSAYQIGGPATTSVLSGLPDFVVNIDAIGYLTAASADSFVASSTVPSGSRPAVKFTIKNIGTNKSGEWRFSASIPTQSSYIYFSPFQQSLSPGERIEYTLGFDQPIAGANKTISIMANFDSAIGESNTNNNSASANLTILGG